MRCNNYGHLAVLCCRKISDCWVRVYKLGLRLIVTESFGAVDVLFAAAAVYRALQYNKSSYHTKLAF